MPVKEAKLASNASMTGLTPEEKAKYAQPLDENSEEDVASMIALQQITDDSLEFDELQNQQSQKQLVRDLSFANGPAHKTEPISVRDNRNIE